MLSVILKGLVICTFFVAMSVANDVHAQSTSMTQMYSERQVASLLDFGGSAEMGPADLSNVLSHPAIKKYMLEGGEEKQNSFASLRRNPLSDYETFLPHTTKPNISQPEKALLKAYLNHPKDTSLIKVLAIVHLKRSLVNQSRLGRQGEAFKHTLIAQYFLSRAIDLGAKEKWIQHWLDQTQIEIDKVLSRSLFITSEENHPAHSFFIEAFNYREGNRYLAAESLLEDFVIQPKNVYTAFTLTAANLWIGDEGDYDDPTVLYNFVLGSYFSVYTMKLAKELEVAWLNDPLGTPRFRMASILGGFSVLHRKWMAKMHGEKDAVDAIDNEHREWRLIHRSFHAFTVGLAFFEEKENFAEGFQAWQDALPHCAEVPVRTCSNQPRFSHNGLGFFLGYVDFLLKDGDINAAKQVLSLRFAPPNVFPPAKAYTEWDLGRDAWEHREKNLNEISALYRNANPADDPLHFFMKKKKWGGNLPTCQTCHQAQSTVWTEEEKNRIILPPEEVATVGVWPEVSTSWYGSIVKPAFK